MMVGRREKITSDQLKLDIFNLIKLMISLREQ